jgi:hypothetical protein
VPSVGIRRTLDAQVFYAAETEDVYCQDIGNLNSEAREQVTFNGWLDDMLLRGVLKPSMQTPRETGER